MGKFKQFLNEDYAPLYHFTRTGKMLKIIEEDSLKASISCFEFPGLKDYNGDKVNYFLNHRICFSRDKNFDAGAALGGIYPWRIAFDKNKLASNFKIDAYSSPTYDAPELMGNPNKDPKLLAWQKANKGAYAQGEHEERIMFFPKKRGMVLQDEKFRNTTHEIKNIHKYILKIEQIDEPTGELARNTKMTALELIQCFIDYFVNKGLSNCITALLVDYCKLKNNLDVYCEKYNIPPVKISTYGQIACNIWNIISKLDLEEITQPYMCEIISNEVMKVYKNLKLPID